MKKAYETYFLYGYYGCGNVGDDLLLSAIIDHLNSSGKDFRIKVKCLNKPSGLSDKNIEFITCETYLADNSLPRWRRFLQYLLHVWKGMMGVNTLIFGGGTLFHAEQGSPINLLILGSVACMARLRGAQVVAVGVGVAPIKGICAKLLMTALLLMTEDFAVRDATSYKHCMKFPGSRKVRQTADLVFLTDTSSGDRNKSSQKVLGLTLAASAMRQINRPQENMLKELGTAINSLAKDGWEIQFLSFQELAYSGGRLSDSMLVESLREAGLSAQVRIIELNSEKRCLEQVFSGIDLIAGMRFHSLVLSAIAGIPFIGIGSDHKISDLCGRYEFPFLCLNDFNNNRLLSSVSETLQKTPDARITEELRKAAFGNFAALN